MNTAMAGAGSFDLLHLVGFLTGAVLYGMLIVMVTRPPARADTFALSTGLLGLVWNVGELAAYAARLAGLGLSISWIHAFSFSALGLLASVVVHSVARAPVRLGSQPHIVGSVVAAVVYACATFAGVMHVIAAATGQTLPSSLGLTVLTIGLLAVIPALITVARRQLNAPRALWMATLAVVAVSALHLGRLHGAQESWPVELIGHHASIVLAFAILYQDYRFAFADLFLEASFNSARSRRARVHSVLDGRTAADGRRWPPSALGDRAAPRAVGRHRAALSRLPSSGGTVRRPCGPETGGLRFTLATPLG